jgi:polyketide cyclase/dehydrase/lipid transport protein
VIRVSVVVHAPPARVWAHLRDIASHVAWMDDAVAIRFTSASREGVGTTFECDTVVGPFRLTDRMLVTEWQPRRRIGIRHEGVVTGVGRLGLRRSGWRSTRVSWEERLRFPWWLGGPVGSLGATPVLRRVWRRDLANLRRLVEEGQCTEGCGR